MLPLGGGFLRPRYPRHDPPAPVRQGGAGADGEAGRLLRRVGIADSQRRNDPAEARPAVPQDGAVQWRHGFLVGQDLRPRGVAAGAEHLPRNLLLLEFRDLSGAPYAGALQGGAGQTRVAAYAERVGAGGGTHAGGDPGELPERRRQRDRAGGVLV